MDIFSNIETFIFLILALYLLVKFFAAVRIVPSGKVYLVERLGKYHTNLMPGFHILIPFIDKVTFIQDMRECIIDVPPQECFTKDNVRVLVDGVLYLRVEDPRLASYGIRNYELACSVLAQTTTRSIIGNIDLDKTFEERELISNGVIQTVSQAGLGWGVSVLRYEIRNILPPDTVRNAMERLKTAESEQRAIVSQSEGKMKSLINQAEGERQSMLNEAEGDMTRRINIAEGIANEIRTLANATGESLDQIAQVMTMPGAEQAMKLQLGQVYLETLGEIARENTKIVLPANILNVESILKELEIKEIPKNYSEYLKKEDVLNI